MIIVIAKLAKEFYELINLLLFYIILYFNLYYIIFNLYYFLLKCVRFRTTNGTQTKTRRTTLCE